MSRLIGAGALALFSVLLVGFASQDLAIEAATSALEAEPIFVGRETADSLQFSREKRVALTYMTAREMQATVVSLTGYWHPAFLTYEDVLGKYDPSTGQRTTDKPSMIGILFMEKIAEKVAEKVILRESFLDDEERIVFPGIDFETSPNDEEVRLLFSGFYSAWLARDLPDAVFELILTDFRSLELAGGTAYSYEKTLALMLQHGGIYYY